MQQSVTKISVKVVKAKSTKLLLRAREGEEKQLRLRYVHTEAYNALARTRRQQRKELLSLRKEQQTIASANANRTLTYRATRDSNAKTTCHSSVNSKVDKKSPLFSEGTWRK